ncbi:MAG: CHASE3 domain-containing protein, partial [Candidatus Eremiobacteraeota bacterium]|nr:CHASE3 domain-containing protein [Candidatus Eremiobacteraeota bacterium]
MTSRSLGGTFVAGAILAIALGISVFGSIITYSELNASFDREIAVARARDQYALLYRLTLDEETGLRGYLAAGQKSFLRPYYDARPRFDPTWRQIERFARATNLSEAAVPLRDLRTTHRRWLREVSDPLIGHPTAPSALAWQKHGKFLTDRMRGDFHRLDNVLQGQI